MTHFYLYYLICHHHIYLLILSLFFCLYWGSRLFSYDLSFIVILIFIIIIFSTFITNTIIIVTLLSSLLKLSLLFLTPLIFCFFCIVRAPDCSAMTCPSGKAWVDIATNSYTAHSLEECSGRGLCQRDTGRCKCIGQFAG